MNICKFVVFDDIIIISLAIPPSSDVRIIDSKSVVGHEFSKVSGCGRIFLDEEIIDVNVVKGSETLSNGQHQRQQINCWNGSNNNQLPPGPKKHGEPERFR